MNAAAEIKRHPTANRIAFGIQLLLDDRGSKFDRSVDTSGSPAAQKSVKSPRR
jgi:hypothetical protein